MTPRRRFPIFSAAACALALLLAAASFRDRHLYSTPTTLRGAPWSVHLADGRVIVSRHHLVSSYISMPPDPSWRNAGGFSFDCRRFSLNGGPVSGQVMGAHLALPTYPLALGAAVLLAHRLRRWRCVPTSGHCPTCGYDLRATPARCPECGTPAP